MISSMRVHLAAALLLGACSGDMSLSTNRNVYESELGTTTDVVLALTNGTSRVVHYDLCGAVLENRLPDGTWTRLARPGAVCTAIGNNLHPALSASLVKQLDAQLELGTYRYVATYFFDSSSGDPIVIEEVRSNEFQLVSH